MQRIYDATAAASLPAPPALAGAVGYFTEGTPGVTAATNVRGWFLNMIQEELLALLTATGITPDTTATSFAQVTSAIRLMAGAGITTVTSTGSLAASAAGLVVVNATSGSISLTLPAAAAANSTPIKFRFVRSDSSTNSVTLVLHSGDTMLLGGAASLFPISPGSVVDLVSDGGTHWVSLNPVSYQFDESVPPGSDVTLLPRDRMTITFAGAATIPFKVASVPGVYRVTSVLTADNTTDANLELNPNNTTYTAGFKSWSIANSDANLTAFGSATTSATLTGMTVSGAGVGPFMAAIPLADYFLTNSFNFDQFIGPGGSDTVNDIGPSILEMIISTTTVAKMIKFSSGISGGPAIGFSRWTDTTTAWSSLGTMLDQNGTLLSGSLTIERLS